MEWTSFMSGWAGSSSSKGGSLAHLALKLAGILVFLAPAAQARVYLRQDEALAIAFPPPLRVERKTLFVDDAQARRVETEAGSRLDSRVITYYVGRDAKGLEGFAYFDTHLVRTFPETIMVVVEPDGFLRRIDILSFAEPEDYLPRDAWLRQFKGRTLDTDLNLRRGIRALTGASLTASAITTACRRILALHRVATEKRP